MRQRHFFIFIKKYICAHAHYDVSLTLLAKSGLIERCGVVLLLVRRRLPARSDLSRTAPLPDWRVWVEKPPSVA
jgi:hypothetical protein